MPEINRQELYDSFHLFPANKDKSPKVKWTNYFDKKIPFDKISDCDFIGLICGIDGLEVIDIDNHFNDADNNLQFIKDNFDLDNFLIVKTGRGGYHIYFKSDYFEGNLKLARKRIIENDVNQHIIEGDLHYIKPPSGDKMLLRLKDGNWQAFDTIVETRGKGGYVIAPGSTGYDIVNGDLTNIVKLSKQSRTDLMEICKALDESDAVISEKEKSQLKTAETKPGDLYLNDILAVDETKKILRQNGWYSDDDIHWRRPGKDKGFSATFGKVGKNKFYVFSSNAEPFEPNSSNSMLWVKSLLEYNGDIKLCIKDLAKRYNVPTKKKEESKPKQKKTSASQKKWNILQQIIKEWKLKFRFNELLKVLEYRIKDSDFKTLGLLINDIIFEMENNRGIPSISYAKVDEMLRSQKICEIYNPVKSFFKRLPKWNGKNNFHELMKYIKLPIDENYQYFEIMLKKHLIRTVRCGLTEDINRMVLTFYGKQEIGKSLFFRWLVPSEIYSDEIIDPADKDSVLSLSRYLVLNMDDIDSLNKREVGKLKSFISKGDITKRVAYGRSDERFKRVASFVASTNKRELLTDESNTRWIILKTADFDWKGYKKAINPLQLWAEALHYFKDDEYSGELTDEEKNERDKRNKKEFLDLSTEHELLQRYFTVSVKEEENIPMTSTQIFENLTDLTNIRNLSRYNLGRALVTIFGQPTIVRVKKDIGPQKVYYVKPLFDIKTEIPDEFKIITNNLPF